MRNGVKIIRSMGDSGIITIADDDSQIKDQGTIIFFYRKKKIDLNQIDIQIKKNKYASYTDYNTFSNIIKINYICFCIKKYF